MDFDTHDYSTHDEGDFEYDPYYDDPMDPTDAEDRW